MRTEIDFWVVIDWHVDLLLGLSRPTVVGWRVVAWDDLHRLLDELVTFVFQLLAVTVLARVDTSTEVVVLRRWRARAGFISTRLCRDHWVALTDRHQQARHR